MIARFRSLGSKVHDAYKEVDPVNRLGKFCQDSLIARFRSLGSKVHDAYKEVDPVYRLGKFCQDSLLNQWNKFLLQGLPEGLWNSSWRVHDWGNGRINCNAIFTLKATNTFKAILKLFEHPLFSSWIWVTDRSRCGAWPGSPPYCLWYWNSWLPGSNLYLLVGLVWLGHQHQQYGMGMIYRSHHNPV